MITLNVGNIFTNIEGDLPHATYKQLEQKLSFRPQGYVFSPNFQRWIRDENGKPIRRVWDGWKRLCWKNKKTTYFPTGLFSLALEFFKENNIPFKCVSSRHKPQKNIHIDVRHGFEFRDYQTNIINTACDIGRGIIQAPTGAGKTSISAGIIQKLGVSPFIYFVTSIDLLTQAKESLQDILLQNGSPLRVGQIGAGVIDIADVNVMTIQTAVRALGEKWNKDTKFDTDDTDDDTEIEFCKKDIVELINSAKGAISDECITGDSIIITREGPVRMDSLRTKIGQDVQSFDGNGIVWKKITHFYPKGKQRIVKVLLSNGMMIRCTADHLIMTKNGWMEAGKLQKGNLILCTANAAVEQSYASQGGVQADSLDTFSDTRLREDRMSNGRRFLTTSSHRHQSANAGVENKSIYAAEHYKYSSNKKGTANTTGLSTAMTSDQLTGKSNSILKRNRQYLGRCLEIPRFLSRLPEVDALDFMAPMDYVSLNGRSLKPDSYQGCYQDTGSIKTKGTETDLFHLEHPVTQNCYQFMTLYTKMAENILQSNGCPKLGQSGWHGGFVTMGAEKKLPLLSIRKDSQKKKSNYLRTGCLTDTVKPLSTNTEDTVNCTLVKMQENELSQKYTNTSHSVCNTSYVRVKSIEECGEEKVFDISVEDTHCFFANGILVHNCQHWRASTCQLVTRELKSAYNTFALSATPYRDDGDDMLVQACFGRIIAKISFSELIDRGYLVQPNIKMIHIRQPKSAFKQWQSIYKEQVVENEYYNNLVCHLANKFCDANRLVLVLSQQVSHGQYLASKINDSIYLSGNSPKKKRQQGIDQLRKKEISCISSSVIFDEGIDIRPLDTVILAGQGKSKVRTMQRIGRALRPWQDENGKKEKATIIDFHIHQKYLDDHAKERLKMYKSEPRFKVEEVEGKS